MTTRARPHVEGRAVLHRLADAERDRDQIGKQRDPEADRDRDRHLFEDELHHRDVAEIAVAEIEAGIVPEHHAEAFERRLVEAELLFQLGDEFGVEPLRTAVFGRGLAGTCRDCPARPARRPPPPESRVAAALAGELGDDLLDRSARRELDDGKGNRHDAEQGRDHQKDAPEDIGGHQAETLASSFYLWSGDQATGMPRYRFASHCFRPCQSPPPCPCRTTT